VPALLYVVTVFVLGSLPQGPQLPSAIPFADKLAHLLGFAIMQWVLFRSVHFLWPEQPGSWKLWRAFVVASCLGALLELWQALLPSRSMELLDWVADTLGALLMALWLGRTATLPERQSDC
jgi:VanZ family protein